MMEASIDKMLALRQEIREHKAEIERLRADNEQLRSAIVSETKRFIDKVERLTAALADLLAHDYAEECQECGIGRSAAWKNARATLEEGKPHDSTSVYGAECDPRTPGG
jgi:hypothetical protein